MHFSILVHNISSGGVSNARTYYQITWADPQISHHHIYFQEWTSEWAETHTRTRIHKMILLESHVSGCRRSWCVTEGNVNGATLLHTLALREVSKVCTCFHCHFFAHVSLFLFCREISSCLSNDTQNSSGHCMLLSFHFSVSCHCFLQKVDCRQCTVLRVK